jgi:hypothetical protein
MSNVKRSAGTVVIMAALTAAAGCATELDGESSGNEYELPGDERSSSDDFEVDEEGKKKPKPWRYRFYRSVPWTTAMVDCPDKDTLRTYALTTPKSYAASNGLKCGFSGLDAQSQCAAVVNAARYNGVRVCAGWKELRLQKNSTLRDKRYVWEADLWELYR